MKKVKQFACIAFIAACLTLIALIRTDGFSAGAIRGALPHSASLPPSAEIRAILSQPFSYLGKGRQCFVFESQDGQYVLKFFNQNYFKLPWYGFITGNKERRKRGIRRHFYEHSYSIAYRELGDGLCYVHLGPSDPLPVLQLRDKANALYWLDLSSFPFVLQKKGQPFYPSLEAVYLQEGLAGLCREIDGFIVAVGERIAKNIADADVDVEHNWGYVQGRIFHLDPGRLYYEDLTDPARRAIEWRRASRRFYKWLGKRYPEAAVYLKQQIPREGHVSNSI